MSAADPPIEEDVIDVDELENVSGKNHRPLDDIWQYYKKIKLPFEQAAKLHRHYDATCKGCGDRVSGKPQLMRKHTSKCTSTPLVNCTHCVSKPRQLTQMAAISLAINQLVRKVLQRVLTGTLTVSESRHTRSEITELFAEYYESDCKEFEGNYMLNDKSTNTDIDFNHPALAGNGGVASSGVLARAVVGSSNDHQQFDILNMISE
ncbi:TPA: hypothetical protein ACH3X1_000386 [Trebouxia sp. C0004]